MLRELGEMGMDLARALKAQALSALDPDAPEAPKVTDSDPVLMFTRVARAVRQTLALEIRCSNPDAETERWRAEAVHARTRRKAEVGEIARGIIREDAPQGAGPRLLRALECRLEAELEADEDFNYLSTGVLLARICKQIGVTPDWSLWGGEPWALDEAQDQTPGSPFAGPNAAPLFQQDEEPEEEPDLELSP